MQVIAKLIERFRKRRVLGSYVKILAPLLKKRYGNQKFYTEAQVAATLKAAKLSERYKAYALAMYLSRKSYEQLVNVNEVSYDRSEARREIADEYFGGDSDFSFDDSLGAADASSGFFGGHGDSGGGVSDGGNGSE